MEPSLEEKLAHLNALVERGLVDEATARAERARLLRGELGGGRASPAPSTASPEPPPPSSTDSDVVDALEVVNENGVRQYVVRQPDRTTRIRADRPSIAQALFSHRGITVYYGVEPPLADLEEARQKWLPGVVKAALKDSRGFFPLWSGSSNMFFRQPPHLGKHRVLIRQLREHWANVWLFETRPSGHRQDHALPDEWRIEQPWTVALGSQYSRGLVNGQFWDVAGWLGRELGYRIVIS